METGLILADECAQLLLGLSLSGLAAAIMLWASLEKEQNKHSAEGTKRRLRKI